MSAGMKRLGITAAAAILTMGAFAGCSDDKATPAKSPSTSKTSTMALTTTTAPTPTAKVTFAPPVTVTETVRMSTIQVTPPPATVTQTVVQAPEPEHPVWTQGDPGGTYCETGWGAPGNYVWDDAHDVWACSPLDSTPWAHDPGPQTGTNPDGSGGEYDPCSDPSASICSNPNQGAGEPMSGQPAEGGYCENQDGSPGTYIWSPSSGIFVCQVS